MRGKITEEHRAGNHRADAIALDARRSNHEWESAELFCDAFAVRQRTYSKLVWQIGVQIVRVFLTFKAAKENAERLAPFTTNAENRHIPIALDYADPTNANA